jgi:hypothetical protein
MALESAQSRRRDEMDIEGLKKGASKEARRNRDMEQKRAINRRLSKWEAVCIQRSPHFGQQSRWLCRV